MNTPKPCDECKHLYYDAMSKDTPDGYIDCKKGDEIGTKDCEDFAHYKSRAKCVFTTTIAETPACAIDDGGELFDENGIPLKDCPDYPCDKYKEIKEKCRIIDLSRLVVND